MKKGITVLGLMVLIIGTPLTYYLFDTIEGQFLMIEMLGRVGASSVVTASQIDIVSGYNTLPTGKYLKVLFASTQVDSYMRFDAPTDFQVSDGSKLQNHLEVYLSAYPPSRYLSFTSLLAVQAKTDLGNKDVATTVGNKQTVASAWKTQIPYRITASKDSVYLSDPVDLLGKMGLVQVAPKVWVEKLGITLSDQYPEVVTTDTVALGYKDKNGWDRWTLIPPYDLQNYLDNWNKWMVSEASGCWWNSDWSYPYEAIYGCEKYALVGATLGSSEVPVDHTGKDGKTVYSCDLGKDIWTRTLGSEQFWYGTAVMSIKVPNIGSDLKRLCVVSSNSPTPIIDKANSFLLDMFSSSGAEKASIDSNGFTLTYPTSALGNMALVVWADVAEFPTVKEVIIAVKPLIQSASLSSNSVDEQGIVRLTVSVKNDGDAGDIWIRTDIRGFENMPSKKIYLGKGQSETVVFEGSAPNVDSNVALCGKAYATATLTVESPQLCYTSRDIRDEVILVTPAPTVKPGTTPPPGMTDKDSDGIVDSDDSCPDRYGLKVNSGCPPDEEDLPTTPAPTSGPVPEGNDFRIPRAVAPLIIGSSLLGIGISMKKRGGKLG